jgi:uncharacterized membrane protein YkoI
MKRMERRLFLLLISLTVAAVPLRADIAYADDDNSGSGGDDDGDDDSSDDGDDDGGDDSSDDSDDDGGDDSPDDSGGDGGTGGTGGTGTSNGGTGSTGGTGAKTPDHDRAQDAVAHDAAIPLKTLLALFRQSYEGEIVDVTLIKRRSGLVYRVKFVDPKGRVRRAEFDALSGTILD